jgi:hydroxylamine reductase (hybrid-cluster protein)
MDVLKISGSITYDGLKKLVTARCASIEANIATLYLCLLVGAGKMTIKEVKNGDLYAKHIRGEAKTHDEMRAEMRKLKQINNKKYKKEIKQEFATYAFTRCYKPKAGNKTRKSTKVGKGLKNTRNQKCTSRKSTVCCPHMAPDDKGRYAATNEMTPLKYRGKKYELHTCCKMCGTAMNRLAASNPDKFKKIYISGFNKRGDIIAKNKYTDKEIQILKLIK